MITKKQSNSERRYDIDWLRIFVILLLFPFHSARIFDYWEPNYVKNIDLSWGLSWFLVIRSGLGVVPKYLGITVLSFFSCIAIYDLIIRRFVITRWLFGVKVGAASKVKE